MRRITIIFSTIFSFGLLFAEQPSGDSDGHAYLELANRVFDTALSEGQAYAMLRELCLDIGPRLSGSPQAAAAVEWGRQTMQRAGLQQVRRMMVRRHDPRQRFDVQCLAPAQVADLQHTDIARRVMLDGPAEWVAAANLGQVVEFGVLHFGVGRRVIQ